MEATAPTDWHAQGESDFAAGLPCIPFLAMGDEFTLEGGRAWQRGWINANLAAPIPEWTDEENAAMVAAMVEAGR